MPPCCVSQNLGIVRPSITLSYISFVGITDGYDGYAETLKQNSLNSFAWFVGAFNNAVIGGLREES
jgi:hypothetical protein